MKENYTGFPSLNTHDKHEYDSQCLLLEVTASEKKGYEAVGRFWVSSMIFIWDDEFVPVNAGVSSIKQDTVFSLPEKVALIIDGNVGSSGEQMILDMRACSTRTVVYGKDNTLGCLDYSNTRRVDLPNSKISMYIPMTRSCRLPDKGIDKTGIASDVRLDLPYPKKLTDNVDEWVRWVAKDLLKL